MVGTDEPGRPGRAARVLRCRGADLVDGAGNVVKLKGVNWFGFNTGGCSSPLSTLLHPTIFPQNARGNAVPCL